MEISVVIPVYNEAESIEKLYMDISDVLDLLPYLYEIIFVDDGSTDRTFFILQGLLDKNREKVKVIKFRRNFGKTIALVAGFKQARGDVIITTDADLQNDPLDIPMFIDKINQGYDFVCGWRINRKDNILRVIVSRIYNSFLSIVFKTKFHDIDCGFKAFKKRVIDEIELHNGEHRFIPILAAQKYFKVTEVEIKHYRRRFGKSKYPIFRFGAFFDVFKFILATKCTRKYR